MKKIVAICTLFAFAINMLISTVGAIVLCAHSNHIHFDFAQSHTLSHTHSDSSISHQIIKTNHCTDFLLVANSATKSLSKTIELPSPKISDAEDNLLTLFNFSLGLHLGKLASLKPYTNYISPPQIPPTSMPLII